MRDNLGRRGFVPATLLLMSIWALIFALEFQLTNEALVDIQVRYGLLPGRFLNGLDRLGSGGWAGLSQSLPVAFESCMLPLFSYQFLHADVIHLLSNLLFFWVFGSRLECHFCSARFLGFFLLAGAFAGIAQIYLGADPSVSTIGASGGIAGTMSAYMLLFFHSRILLLIPVFIVPIFVEVAAPILVLGWFALQFRPVMKLLGLGPGEPIAWDAHIGGFLAGMLLLPLAVWGRKSKRRPKRGSGRAEAASARPG